ncbi:MAG: alcohol dehydrogenase catalytic domain-containing protein [Verrucomicrobiota bacterium]|nr:alcohol dehydrogenase catalytic domain-containing protein [Verrucomicrobiota bacterium]
MIDKNMLAWPLYGKGLENVGKNEKPSEVPIPEPNENELLVRIDAIGLCFSDIKLIRAGEEHPRVISEDLKTDPVIPGHEAVMTVVKVGENLKEQYKNGQRFIIQADIYVNGKGFAYGYAIDGGMAQYSLIDSRVLDGDEGCYLLPLSDKTPSALAALVEPWTCVIASYMIEHRTDLKSGGKMLVVADSAKDYTFGNGNSRQSQPAKIDCIDLSDATLENLKKAFPDADFNITDTTEAEYDDIAICGVCNSAKCEEMAVLAARNGLISFVGDYPETLLFDVGNIHYTGWLYQGTETSDIALAYGKNIRSELKKDGCCWLAGGAGAMGQMHTQLAVEMPNGPSKILMTDMDNERIKSVEKFLGSKIKEKGIEFLSLNPGDFDSVQDFNKAVKDFAPDGFDDIVMLVPVTNVLAGAGKEHSGKDCLMNIFAGIPAGKKAELSLRDIVESNVRYVGSSGSLTKHLKHTLSLVEENKLSPASALAAIGGMHSLHEGLTGVAEARFPGKTVIFPNYDMPLTKIENIEDLRKGISETMKDGLYSLETEEKLLEVLEVL